MPSPLIHQAIAQQARAAQSLADAAAEAWHAARETCEQLARSLNDSERRPPLGTSAQLEAIRSQHARHLIRALASAEAHAAALEARWSELAATADELARQQRGLDVLAQRERAAQALARRRAEDRALDEANDRRPRLDPYASDLPD